MIRFIGGFICGVGALAAILIGEHEPLPKTTVKEFIKPEVDTAITIPSGIDILNNPIHLLAGVYDDKAAAIRVDKNGYVICSKE